MTSPYVKGTITPTRIPRTRPSQIPSMSSQRQNQNQNQGLSADPNSVNAGREYDNRVLDSQKQQQPEQQQQSLSQNRISLSSENFQPQENTIIVQSTVRDNQGNLSSPDSNSSPQKRNSEIDSRNGNEIITCDRCENEIATFFCNDCKKPFCETCILEIHSMGKWISHISTQLSRNEQQPLSSQQPSQNLSQQPSSFQQSPSQQQQQQKQQQQQHPQQQYNPLSLEINPSSQSNQAFSVNKPTSPLNVDPIIDYSEEQRLPIIKDQIMDDVIEMLMGVCLQYLFDGIYLKNANSQTHFFLRLNEEQTVLDYCEVPDINGFDPKANSAKFQSVNIVDIVDITETTFGKDACFTLKFRSKNSMSFIGDHRAVLVYVFDGLRCLTGTEMQTKEMKDILNTFIEVKAVSKMYTTAPPLPPLPPNYNFLTPL